MTQTLKRLQQYMLYYDLFNNKPNLKRAYFNYHKAINYFNIKQYDEKILLNVCLKRNVIKYITIIYQDFL